MISPQSRNSILDLQYKVPTGELVTGTGNPRCYRTFTAEINVDVGSEFPELPSSVWIISLTAVQCGAHYGVKSSVSIGPKGLGAEMKSRHPVTVECRTRTSDEEAAWDIVSVVRIDFEGWRQLPLRENRPSYSDNGPLDRLFEKIDRTNAGCGQGHYSLVNGSFFFVQLLIQWLEHEDVCFSRTDLQRLLESRTLSDCSLVCQDQEFPVHRAVLAAQSPVFAAMFQNEMQEKSLGVCKINDTTADLLQIVVRFAYTRAPFHADGKLVELWNVADKYDMPDLRRECVRMMMESITAENALEYFDFARQHNFLPLQRAAATVFGCSG